MSFPTAKLLRGFLPAVFTMAIACAGQVACSQAFSLICMPDPQYYTNSNHPTLYDLYRKQTRWIRDNKAAYNIQHVIWLGDLTNDNTSGQWSTAGAAYTILDTNSIPYAVVPGNHDYKTPTGWAGANFRDLTRYNQIVGPQRFIGKSWYGGNMGNTTNRNENNYTYFSGGGLNFLVIGLEYAPRKEVLTWANNLIKQHPNHRVILFTHAFMTTNGAYGGGGGGATGTVGADGSGIFNECAGRHSNVFLVACGHVTESVVNTKTGAAGNTLYEMLVDYQSEKVLGTGDNLGNGWLRILKFNPATNLINASTVTPADGDTSIFTGGVADFYNGPYTKNPAAADHLFNLPYNMGPLPEPYSYLNTTVAFAPFSPGNNLTSDQLDPDMAQSDVGDFAVTWEDDSNDDGVYQVYVRGFDSDGNERFARNLVNTPIVNAINPSIAMAPDGRFVVAYQSGTNEIRFRTYNANGNPTAAVDQLVLSAPSPGTVTNPDVAMDNNGNFVITWTDDVDGNGLTQVRAQGYAFDGSTRFTAKTINTISAGMQQNPVIAMGPTGNYAIAWEDDNAGTWDINMRGFLANETQMFTQANANATTVGEQRSPDIAMDSSGRFVTIWEDDNDLNSSFQIYARGFNANGTQMFSERTVNVDATGNQINPAIAMNNTGSWFPVWEDNGASGTGYQVMANVWDISGNRVNAADTRINTVTNVTNNFGPPSRKSPVISGHKSGRYLVTWADDMDGNLNYQTLTRGMGGTARALAIKSFNGTVSKFPDDAFYAPNAVVNLTATPAPGYSFVRWTGDVPGGSQTANPLPLTMNSAKKVVKAEYAPKTAVEEWPLY